MENKKKAPHKICGKTLTVMLIASMAAAFSLTANAAEETPAEPDIPTAAVVGTVDEPETAVDEPETAVNETEPTVDEPETAVNETEPTVDEPETAVNETEPTVDEPETAVNEAELTVDEPETAVNETEPTVDEPETAVDETEPTVDEPETTVDEDSPSVLGATFEKQVVENDNYIYSVKEDGTVELYGIKDTSNADNEYSSRENFVVIPETIDGKTVTSVSALHDNDDFSYSPLISKAVLIPETVTEIDPDELWGIPYTYVRYVVIGVEGSAAETFAYEHPGYTFISTAQNTLDSGDYRYINNDDGTVTITDYIGNEKNVKVPEKIDGKVVKEIRDAAFICANIESIEVPGTVEYIGHYAFAYCSDLKKVVLNEGLLDIGYNTFYWSGVEDFTIPKSTTASAGTFAGTPWLNAQTDEFVVVGDGVFIKYNGEGGRVVIPDNVKVIVDAFDPNGWSWWLGQDITNIKEVVIPDSVQYIWGDAFANCTELTEITLPDSVVEIGQTAFFRCTSLKKIVIPGSVVSMPYDDIFERCSDELTIYGYDDTLAESYAKKNNIKFVSLGVWNGSSVKSTTTATTTTTTTTNDSDSKTVNTAATANTEKSTASDSKVDAPKTGDSSTTPAIVSLFAAISGLFTAAALRRKKKTDE